MMAGTTSMKESMTIMSTKNEVAYKDRYFTLCPACSTEIEGEGMVATGMPLDDGYEPDEGELLKNLWIECDNCGWNQAS